MALASLTILATSTPLVSVAAPPPDPGGPSRQQVDRADRTVAAKQKSVTEIESQLLAAQASVDAAAQDAALAFEAYNGARWKLSLARKEVRRTRTASTAAAGQVEAQRLGIATLVTESYQNGTDLTAATALLSDEGPEGLMTRYGVVRSAGDSMQAAYERFAAATSRAETFAVRASRAEKRQQGLATEAEQLAEAAGRTAARAGEAANAIATRRSVLIQELARAQNISIDLARRRTAALEQDAATKKAQAAAEKDATLQAQLQQQADAAAAEAEKSKKNQPNYGGSKPGSKPGSAPGDKAGVPANGLPAPVVGVPANQAAAVARAIAFARAQVGKPYEWAAAGPDSFDCSGLTMRAWARGGKSLPHYSVAQFEQSTRITMADARPGDLVFWTKNGAASGIYHVALYIGGGQTIEAPRTGLKVRYNSIYSNYPDLVARP